VKGFVRKIAALGTRFCRYNSALIDELFAAPH
jgi:hypothetical protein